MRILAHAPTGAFGAAISVRLLLRFLRKQGCETETMVWQSHSGRDLGELVRAFEPDWVFTQGRAAPEVALEAKKQGSKVAVFVWSIEEQVCPFRKAGLLVCPETGRTPRPLTCGLGCLGWRADAAELREMFIFADLVVCSSDYARRVVSRVFGEVRKGGPLRAMVQHPLIDARSGQGLCRRRYITVVRPGPGRGQRLFERLTRLLPGHEFLVVGGGRMDVPWERVAFVPAALSMDEVYRAARILLHPAVEPEAFGRTVAEAASFGVPSVVSRQGGLPEALGPGGIAVEDFEDPAAWARAIGEVEKDYEKYSRLALEHSRNFLEAGALMEALRSGLRPAGAELSAAA